MSHAHNHEFLNSLKIPRAPIDSSFTQINLAKCFGFPPAASGGFYDFIFLLFNVLGVDLLRGGPISERENVRQFHLQLDSNRWNTHALPARVVTTLFKRGILN